MEPEEIKKRIRNGLNALDKRTARRMRWTAAVHKSRCQMLERLHKRYVVQYGADSIQVKRLEAELKTREMCVGQCVAYAKAVKVGMAKRDEMDQNP